MSPQIDPQILILESHDPLHRLRSRRHARRLAARPRGIGERAARRVRLRAACRRRRSAAWSGDGAATLVARAFAAGGCPAAADALARFLAIYNARLLKFTRPYPRIPEVLEALEPRAAARRADQQAARLHARDPRRARSRAVLPAGSRRRRRRPASAQARSRRACCTSATASASMPPAALLVGDSVVDWRTARAAGTRVCLARYGFGFEGFPVGDLGADDACDRLAGGTTGML